MSQSARVLSLSELSSMVVASRLSIPSTSLSELQKLPEQAQIMLLPYLTARQLLQIEGTEPLEPGPYSQALEEAWEGLLQGQRSFLGQKGAGESYKVAYLNRAASAAFHFAVNAMDEFFLSIPMQNAYLPSVELVGGAANHPLADDEGQLEGEAEDGGEGEGEGEGEEDGPGDEALEENEELSEEQKIMQVITSTLSTSLRYRNPSVWHRITGVLNASQSPAESQPQEDPVALVSPLVTSLRLRRDFYVRWAICETLERFTALNRVELHHLKVPATEAGALPENLLELLHMWSTCVTHFGILFTRSENSLLGAIFLALAREREAARGWGEPVGGIAAEEDFDYQASAADQHENLEPIREEEGEYDYSDLTPIVEAKNGGEALAPVALQHLDVISSNISGRDCEALTQLLIASTALSSLDLTFNNIDDDIGHQLIWSLINGCPTLTSLQISQNHIGPKAAVALGHLLSSPHHGLATLVFSGNNLTATSLAECAEAIASSQTLTYLDLSDNPLTSAGVEILARVLGGNNHLLTLRLEDVEAGSSSFTNLLAALSQQPILQCLSLKKNPLSLEVCEALTKLIKSSNLTELDVSHCFTAVTGACKELFKGMERTTGLRTLRMGSNNMTDVGAMAFVEMLGKAIPIPPFELLDFSENAILTPVCRVLVSKAKERLAPLRHLILSGNVHTIEETRELLRSAPFVVSTFDFQTL